MKDYIRQAFEATCKQATERTGQFVSLYIREQYYGGPEEGGWYGYDTTLVSSQEFPTAWDAEQAKEAVDKLASELSEEAHKEWGRNCLEDCQWLEARGLDANFLPEPDGPDSYFVTIETRPGCQESQGPRHYE